MGKLKIGIVGCGAIGSSLAKAVRKDFSGKARLAALYDLDYSKAQKLGKFLAVKTLNQLISKSQIVIEAASAKVSAEVARQALSKGRSVMVMSVGGLLGHLESLVSLAAKHKAQLYIPSGAISGVDALKAAAGAKITRVILTTRKNPLAFKGVKYVEAKKIGLEKIKKEKVLFSGSAQEAVKFFPQNINVAAVLSLAGIGAQKTQVRIIADPQVTKNIHEVRVESDAGNIFTRTENILHPENPKTSYLAVLSAKAALKHVLEPLKIGT
jgi:aspartate dehydrogenase